MASLKEIEAFAREQGVTFVTCVRKYGGGGHGYSVGAVSVLGYATRKAAILGWHQDFLDPDSEINFIAAYEKEKALKAME